MALPGDWDDLPPQAKEKIKEQDREMLKEVKLVSFDVDPTTIERFEEAKLSWEVQGPNSQFTLKVNDKLVTPKGSMTVKPFSTISYKLTAFGIILSKQLGQRVLTVDDSQCRTTEFPASLVTGLVAEEVRDRFSGNDQIKLKRDSPTVTMDQNGLHIKIASTIDVNNWFDADMDIDMDFRIFAQISEGKARVNLSKTDVDVSWSLLEHAASLFCTSAVQGAMQKLMEVCIQDLLGPYLESDFANQLQGRIDGILDTWQGADSEKREYQLFSITTSPSQLTVVGCPLDAAQRRVLAATPVQPAVAVVTP